MMALPAARGASAERTSLKLLGPDGRRPRLLLAEDCDPVRIVTAAMLKGMGCDVDTAIHGEQAVKSAAESHFDVIVLDIEMPVMDGITAARSIRRLGGPSAAAPLMALSAFLADSMRAGDWHETFDIALPKPANRNELHQALTSALARTKTASAAELVPPLFDELRFAELRRGLDEHVFRQLAEIACRDIETCIRQIEHARDGRRKHALLGHAAKLAGVGRAFAMTRLVWMVRALEAARSEAEIYGALGPMLDAARDTVRLLRG
jgi:CheY-like chemotaxis protein